jgi:peptidyl-dipeptidase Dcp
VHPDYRHLGLGKVLIGRFMVALDELGYKHSFLWTTNELAAAASLYQRHGFVLIEEKASARFGKAVIEQRYDWFRDRK